MQAAFYGARAGSFYVSHLLDIHSEFTTVLEKNRRISPMSNNIDDLDVFDDP